MLLYLKKNYMLNQPLVYNLSLLVSKKPEELEKIKASANHNDLLDVYDLDRAETIVSTDFSEDKMEPWMLDTLSNLEIGQVIIHGQHSHRPWQSKRLE